MTKDDIINKAIEVRNAQKKYYSTRSRYDLKTNIALEKELDNMLAQYSAGECNPTLF